MKKAISLLLAFLMVSGIAAVCTEGPISFKAEAAKALQEGNYIYEIVDGGAVITRYTDWESTEALIVPETLGGYPVTGLGKDAFSSCCFTAIQLPSKLKTIHPWAFAWIGNNLKEISVAPGNGYFIEKDGVLLNFNMDILYLYPKNAPSTSYTIPKTVYAIYDYAFFRAQNLKEVVFPGNVKLIGNEAFYQSSVESIEFEGRLSYIGDEAFGHSQIINPDLPGGIEYLGWDTFVGTPFCKNKDNYDEDGVLYINNYLISTMPSEDKEYYEIKDGTRLIASGAFMQWNNSVAEAVIPNSVRFVGQCAFYTGIGKFTVSEDSQYLSVDRFGVLYNKSKTELIAYPYGRLQTCFVVPDGVIKIDDYALMSEKLYNIYIPDSVVELGLFALGTEKGKVINYEGTEDQWENIVKDTSNEHATNILNSYKKNYNSYEVAEHSMLSFNKKDATCTESGGISWTCSCGSSGFVAESAKGHNLSGVYEKTITQPTCTQSGLKGKICNTCGEVVAPVVIEKLDHKLKTVETVYPTCTESGYVKSYCSLCETYFTEYTEPLGHLRRENAAYSTIKPTCTKDGMTYDSCLRCLEKLDITIIPATGHTEGKWSYLIKPGCTSTGIGVLKCETCGEELDRRSVEPTGHNYSETIVEQSCTVTTKRFYCLGCGDTYYQDTHYVTGNHILETVTEEADCENPGRTYSKCTVCQAIVGDVTETDPAKGHSVGEWVFSGENVFTCICRVCGTAFESITVELKLNRTKISLVNGDNEKLFAEVTENITSDIIFSSSDTSVVSVDSKGNISAISPGTAVITAKISGTDITAACTVDVAARIYPICWLVDGDVYVISQLKEGQKIEEPKPPETDGLEFVGWTPEVPDIMPSHAMTFTAVFNKVSKSAEFDVSATYSPDAFNEPVSLEVKEIEGEREPGGVYMVEGKNYDQIGLYNIKAVNENSEVVQPDEGHTVTLKIPIPEEYRSKTSFVIYHRFVGGGREQLSTEAGTITVENGYLIFEVSSFSEFEVLAETNKAEVPGTPVDKVTPSIKITVLPAKTVYAYGEDIDLTGIRVIYTDSKGEEKTVTDTDCLTVSGFNSKETGKQTVTVKYGDCSDTFEVKVRYTFWQWIIKILTFGLLKF